MFVNNKLCFHFIFFLFKLVSGLWHSKRISPEVTEKTTKQFSYRYIQFCRHKTKKKQELYISMFILIIYVKLYCVWHGTMKVYYIVDLIIIGM